MNLLPLNVCIFMSLKKTKQLLPIGTLSNYCRVNSIVLGGVNSCINPIYNGYHLYFNTKFLFFKKANYCVVLGSGPAWLRTALIFLSARTLFIYLHWL